MIRNLIKSAIVGAVNDVRDDYARKQRESSGVLLMGVIMGAIMAAPVVLTAKEIMEEKARERQHRREKEEKAAEEAAALKKAVADLTAQVGRLSK